MMEQTFAEMRDQFFKAALDRNDGHVSNAAKEIGIGRMTIYRWLKKKACVDAQNGQEQ